jgi:hypothetical protein
MLNAGFRDPGMPLRSNGVLPFILVSVGAGAYLRNAIKLRLDFWQAHCHNLFIITLMI